MCFVETYEITYVCRLIKHTKQLLEENEERLCIKVLQTLREMMTKDRGYGEKVGRAAAEHRNGVIYFVMTCMCIYLYYAYMHTVLEYNLKVCPFDFVLFLSRERSS